MHQYAGSNPYGLTAIDYYPAAPPMQVVPLAPWGSYAEYVHGMFQRRAYDSEWNLRQSHSQADPTEAHNAIQEVLWELESRVDAFHFPNYLDFQQVPSDGQIPQLADTKRNMAVNEHHKKLQELLSKLWGVKTRGDEAVRRSKADAIAQVEEELEELKRQKAVVWYNAQADGQPRRPFWATW
ncbi:unnamed protein product [Rhizoctonia solani]|uniref:Uncharacterized protein n=1 Tax=Rhizoctonia solani TaxID=456999 RepID=A0A8H2WG19_9AGAM|nr:unnamed protein product [Rhizoctonia solani]